jgi:hypothetical protein
MTLIWHFILQIKYDVDDAAFNWFLATAGTKWKEFKADLKKKYFDETLTDEELKARSGDRVNSNDWSYLINFWRSPESKVRNINLFFSLHADDHVFFNIFANCYNFYHRLSLQEQKQYVQR